MTTVVPWAIRTTSTGRSVLSSSAFRTPVARSAGTLSTLAVMICPFASSAARSVNVPPTSIPTATAAFRRVSASATSHYFATGRRRRMTTGMEERQRNGQCNAPSLPYSPLPGGKLGRMKERTNTKTVPSRDYPRAIFDAARLANATGTKAPRKRMDNLPSVCCAQVGAVCGCSRRSCGTSTPPRTYQLQPIRAARNTRKFESVAARHGGYGQSDKRSHANDRGIVALVCASLQTPPVARARR